jgi:chloride channel 3/4/5
VYAIVGASAVLGGATRLTVCLAVTMFEVTGSLIYIIPIMISTVISKIVGDFFGNHGIYDIMVSWKRYPYIPPTSDADPTVNVSTVMSTDPVCIGAFSETLDSLSRMLTRYSFSGFPVVLSLENRSKVIGYISRADLATAVDKAFAQSMHPRISVVLSSQDQPFNLPDNFVDISSYVDKYPVTVAPDTPLDIVLDIFKGLGLRCAIVVKDEVVIGIVKKKDLAEYISTSVMSLYTMPFMEQSGESDHVRSRRNSLIHEDSVSSQEPLLDKEGRINVFDD